MALETKLECIKSYCDEAEYKIKEIKKAMEEFDGYNSLEFMEVKLNNTIRDLEIAKSTIMKTYSEIR